VEEQANFWGANNFSPNFRETCPKNYWATFCALHEERISDDSPKRKKKRLQVICSPFFQIKACWAPFLLVLSGILLRFSGILRRFPQIFPGFSPNQNFGGALAPLQPHLLHQCAVCR